MNAAGQTALSASEDLVLRLFSRGEAFDAAGFATFFTERPLYQFGNFDPCLDHAAIEASARAFFDGIAAVYHDIKTIAAQDDRVMVEMDVHYWRLDGSRIALPCCDIFRVAGDKFSELRIFMDVNPVIDPSITVHRDVSVFTVPKGDPARTPFGMKWFFAEHPHGRDRVASGHAPKWSMAGPRWPVGGADHG